LREVDVKPAQPQIASSTDSFIRQESRTDLEAKRWRKLIHRRLIFVRHIFLFFFA
jgi:hypothetical protein